MGEMPFIAISVFALLIVGIVIAYFAYKKKREAFEKTGKHPKGHYLGLGMGLGMVIFTPIGIALSITTGNPGLMGVGPAIGLSIGLAIGSALEKKHENELRPLTPEEEKFKSIGMKFAIILLVLGAVAAVALFFFRP
ncbi:MAG: hypothetical protein ABIG96_05900 [Candidatus Micrarchaeota archaeon]